MKLQTIVDIPAPGFEISYLSSGVTIGSCFATEVGSRMERLKFDISVNPLGVLYNAASIAKLLEVVLSGREITSEDLFYDGELYNSYLFHSRFSHRSEKETLASINSATKSCREDINRASYIIITLGTSYIYRLKSSGEVVANCHKTTASQFTRECISTEETISYLEKIVSLLSGKEIIFTISPIRHIRDGLSGNNLSKSIARVAIEEITKRHSTCHYFPSFEIMVDELRDYRFYRDDMFHPTPLAVDYIWERVQETFCSKQTLKIVKQVEDIATRLSHRPVNPTSEKYKQFIEATLNKLNELESVTKNINFSSEREILLSVINGK